MVRKPGYRLRWLLAGAAALLLAGGVAFAVHRGETEARLVRADPDEIPAEHALLHFAFARGQAVYEEHCAACHGTGGAGDPARGTPNLADRDWLYGSGMVSEIEKIVTYGIRSHHPKAWNLAVMPAFARPTPAGTELKIPRLTPDGIGDVTEFLIAAGGRPADAQAAKRGAALYGDAGGCYDCHGPDGRGDSAIGAPNLLDSIWLYGDGSRQSIMNSIAYGRQGVCPAWIGKITTGEIREVAVYVYAMSHGATPSNAIQAGG
jgi:cytochrome c oxidase cbb3-type subunit 3